MNRSLEEILSELYISNIDIIGEGLPAGVNAARRGALENFNLLSLPSTSDERYRHIDLRKLFDGEYENYFTPVPGMPQSNEMFSGQGYKVGIINGFCIPEGKLMRLDNGVIYGSLRAAMAEEEELVLKYYNTQADNEREAVTALNTVFMQDGAFVYIPDNVQTDLPFVVSFEYGSDEEAQMCFSRALIVAGENARAQIVISHQSVGEARLLINHVRETVAAKGASIEIAEITSPGDGSSLVAGNYLGQEEGSNVDALSLWLEGGVTRVNAVSDLNGGDCESNLYAIYFARGEEKVDVNMTVNHLVSGCRSNELVKGIVSGEAVGAFTGRVYVARDAQQTEAFQQSRNLQLSDKAKIYTEPQLEIYADDVKCSHGATIGQMDDESVYYMRQRGISEHDARRLQLFGFVNDIITRCRIEGLCDRLAQLAQERINQM